MMDKRIVFPLVAMLVIIGIGLAAMLSIGRSLSTPIPDGIPSPTMIGTARTEVENMQMFTVDRRCLVAVYNYANATYVNIREMINSTPTKKGIVLTANQYHHLKRLIPDITKTVGELVHELKSQNA